MALSAFSNILPQVRSRQRRRCREVTGLAKATPGTESLTTSNPKLKKFPQPKDLFSRWGN
jgi:hypothetical protein